MHAHKLGWPGADTGSRSPEENTCALDCLREAGHVTEELSTWAK